MYHNGRGPAEGSPKLELDEPHLPKIELGSAGFARLDSCPRYYCFGSARRYGVVE
jgi:hypothetical protein